MNMEGRIRVDTSVRKTTGEKTTHELEWYEAGGREAVGKYCSLNDLCKGDAKGLGV